MLLDGLDCLGCPLVVCQTSQAPTTDTVLHAHANDLLACCNRQGVERELQACLQLVEKLRDKGTLVKVLTAGGPDAVPFPRGQGAGTLSIICTSLT